MKKVKLNVRPADADDPMFHDKESGVTSFTVPKKRTKPIPKAPADHDVYTDTSARIRMRPPAKSED